MASEHAMRMGFNLFNKYGRQCIKENKMKVYVNGKWNAIKLILYDTFKLKIFTPKWN